MRTLAKPDLGIKRVCPSCAARFYDLQKRPIECPKCAFTFEPEALVKQRRQRVEEAPPVQVKEVEAEAEEAEELEEAEAEAEPVAAAEPVAEAEEEEVVEAEVETPAAEPAPAEATPGEDFEEVVEEEEEQDDNLLEEVEEEEDDVSGIIDADIEKEEP